MEEKNEITYEKINPDEIIYKLRAMIKILGGENERNEQPNSLNIANR